MKAAFHTLGCKVNQYETECLKEQFFKAGYEIVDETDRADVYVINTCTVTGESDRKSKQFIRRMKKQNPEALVVVCGCMAQVSSDVLEKMPEVDIVAGTNEKKDLVSHVANYRSKEVLLKERKDIICYEELGTIEHMDNRTRAYIKIQEGCDRFCTYCIIPYARGRARSRAASAVVNEAKQLLAAGYKELVLTGINAALYGHEDGYVCDLPIPDIDGIEILIYLLNELPGDFRIRLSSLEPTVINAEYVKRLFSYGKLCKSVHLSLQSGSDRVLSRMGRRYTSGGYMDIVRNLRDFDEDYGITTDIIAGFPGETESDFQESMDIIEKAGFLKTHVFRYSPRKGTAAADMAGQTDQRTKKERSAALEKVAEITAHKFIEGNMGKCRRVLFEEYDKDKNEIKGYTDNYIKVTVNGGEDLLNCFRYVKITGIRGDNAYGEIVQRKELTNE